MLEAITWIERYTQGMSEERFRDDRLVLDAAIRNLEVIGESAHNIECNHADFAARHAGIPWRAMYAMRNRISHGYFSVDPGVIWQTITRSLPDLKKKIAEIREQTP
ncbi:DUF86 domain-containing protein [Paraburkholderia sp. Tr-20389]|nr:DUF86 domain-containing protein [Paraburkholderia sp. Tr-20389]MBN3757808.1 DUF86 domain-containing protein [Paraburkholderia sp. Tr-20389]